MNTRFSHAVCGYFANETPCGLKCNFCHCSCDAEVMRTFHLKITIADESTKIFAWCTGQTATELLQISPDEFNVLSEVLCPNSMIYVSSLNSLRGVLMVFCLGMA